MTRSFARTSRKESERSFPAHATQQFALQFDLTLLERFPSFASVLRACVATSGRPENHIAADCGMSPTEFSRRMADNESDPGHPFPVRKLDALFDAIDPTMAIEWLILKHMQDPELQKQQALATVERAAAVLSNALALLKDRP